MCLFLASVTMLVVVLEIKENIVHLNYFFIKKMFKYLSKTIRLFLLELHFGFFRAFEETEI